MTDNATTECAMCSTNASLDDTTPFRERVFLSTNWRVVSHRSALPGWLLVIPRRHIESLHELTNEESAELGPLLRAATDVLIRVLGARKSYVMLFAEGVKHCHFSVVPRMADLPDARRGAAVSAYNAVDDPQTEDERDAIAERLTLAWRH